jgi:hypothetical protein
MTDLPTGCAFTKVVRETAVTPPLTFLFEYWIFELLVLL